MKYIELGVVCQWQMSETDMVMSALQSRINILGFMFSYPYPELTNYFYCSHIPEVNMNVPQKQVK